MSSETRKKLRTVDISCYLAVIQTFSERLQYRNLKDKTCQNYVSCLKIFFAWCVVFLASKSADLLDYDDFRLFLGFLDMEKLEPRTINVYIRRFLSHVLPKGFTRVRYSGFLSNAWKTRKLQSIHRQRHLTAYVPSPLTGASKRELFLALWNTDISICKCCGAPLIHLPRGQPIH
jgi:hypothetical protein